MIRVETRKVWRSEAAGRAYLTCAAAINAEARAIIRRRYPDEPREYDNIGETHPGFHWSELPRADVLLRRMKRLVANCYAAESARGAP